MKLFETDYVLYDEANDHIVRDSNWEPIIYSNKEEAMNDCYGNETVISCTDLPKHQQEYLKKII